MAKINIGDREDTYVVQKANTTYTLAKGDEINAIAEGILGAGDAAGVHIQINGVVDVHRAGVMWGDFKEGGKSVHVSIGETGRIVAHGSSQGAWLNGDGHRLENAGEISGAWGVTLVGDGSVIDNSGTISGNSFGLSITGGHTIINSGRIESGNTAIGLFSSESHQGAVVRNSGVITGDVAIYGSVNDETIVNSGTIEGAVALLGGDDTFSFKGGLVGKGVYGGEGNDTYVLRKAGLEIAEEAEEGFDTVKTSMSFTLDENFEKLALFGKKNVSGTGNDEDNELVGNTGRNTLDGGHGFDHLFGGRGNDVLTGGLDGDVFEFRKGSGKDTITDFEIGTDEIDLSGIKGAKNFDNMMDQHVRDVNGDAWLIYGDDIVVIKDTTVAELQASDFNFG